MGEFKAGVWLVSLVIYFSFILFIATAVINSSNYYSIDNDIAVSDPGLIALADGYTNVATNTTVDPLAEQDSASITDTVGFMAGFSGDFGIPSTVRWIFTVFFFWIPALMLAFSIYMVLPFIH